MAHDAAVTRPAARTFTPAAAAVPAAAQHRPGRRRLLAWTAAWCTLATTRLRADDVELPHFRALDEYLAGRSPRMERLRLDVPRIADNGNAISMHVALPGPFASGSHVTSIRLFSERNPVPLMALFEFPIPLARIEVDSRIRLAGTQRITAIAETADGALYAAVAEVSVTIAACLDGT